MKVMQEKLGLQKVSKHGPEMPVTKIYRRTPKIT